MVPHHVVSEQDSLVMNPDSFHSSLDRFETTLNHGEARIDRMERLLHEPYVEFEANNYSKRPVHHCRPVGRIALDEPSIRAI